MDFVSKTKFNAPIEGLEGCELQIRGGVTIANAGDLNGVPQIQIKPWDHSIEIDQNATIRGDVKILDSYKAGFLSIDPNERVIDISGDIKSVNSITASGTIDACSISTVADIYAGGSITTSGYITARGGITANYLSTCSIAASTIIVGGKNNTQPPVMPGLIIAMSLMADGSISLSGEAIDSWADLSSHLIQRFTSPELPANCSQFYFEGCGTVTGTDLPFIQVRETATGKLVQTPEMDVWVNLNETCTAYTLGKPVANIEPCTSAIEAGKWTAIVMN